MPIYTHSAEETQEIGRLIGAQLSIGDLILLSGNLGSGKTTLSQGIAWGLEITGYAHSPTFVLVNEYSGRIVFYHIDLYRVDDPGEIGELGIEEMLDYGTCAVEWAEKAFDLLPKEYLLISMEDDASDPNMRRLILSAEGQAYEDLLDRLSILPRSL
jgi:tRNA threonylcarbamoyladenosine biosynthesis protein TsaE